VSGELGWPAAVRRVPGWVFVSALIVLTLLAALWVLRQHLAHPCFGCPASSVSKAPEA
jgi:hypothetical protein